jgi:hypothetical protein
VKVSKRAVAREWLIFLATFALGGGILIFFFAYYDSAGWRGNYEDWFATIFLCFALYVGVTLIRSIWWSIKAVNISKRARYGIIVSIAVLIAAAVGAIAIKNTVDHRQGGAKSESTLARTPELPPRVGAADLRKIILSDVTYEKNPFSGPLEVLVTNGGIKGRLRNELPRKIGDLKLTILFSNSDGKLIETQPVAIDGVFYPGGPTSFLGLMPRSLNLPEGWTWKVTVSDASYTKDEN